MSFLHRHPRLRPVPMMIVMGTIFFLSHQTGDSLPLPDVFGLDKLCHVLAYGALAASVLLAMPPERRCRRPVRAAMVAVAFCLLYGVTDEFHQSFVPQRCPSGFDLIADTVGAAVVAGLWLRLRRWPAAVSQGTGGR